MIAQNSEDCIVRSLKWATEHFEEVNVVHSPSTDRTNEIVGSFPGVTSIPRDFTDFSTQWDAAIAASSKPWVLIMAADEIIYSPWSFDQVVKLLESKERVAGVLPRINFQRDIEHLQAGSYPDPKLVLIRSNLRMNGKPVDEMIDAQGKPVMFLKDINILHWGHIREQKALKQKHHDRVKFAVSDPVDGKPMLESTKEDWFNERNVQWDKDAEPIESKEIKEYAKKWHTVS